MSSVFCPHHFTFSSLDCASNHHVNQMMDWYRGHQWIYLLTNAPLRLFSELQQQYIWTVFRSFLLLKQWMRKHRARRRQNQCKVKNEYDLSLSDITHVTDCFILYDVAQLAKYKLMAHEVISLFRYSLLFSERDYASPHLPRNPYTNKSMTYKQCVDAYFYLLQWFTSRGRTLPYYLSGFRECYFDIERFQSRYTLPLMYRAKSQQLATLSDHSWWKEMDQCVSCYPSLKYIYCKLCIKRSLQTGARIVFHSVLVLHFLNENNMDQMGQAIDLFLEIAKHHGVCYDKAHHKIHRQQLLPIRQERRRSASFTFSLPSPVSFEPIDLTYPLNEEEDAIVQLQLPPPAHHNLHIPPSPSFLVDASSIEHQLSMMQLILPPSPLPNLFVTLPPST